MRSSSASWQATNQPQPPLTTAGLRGSTGHCARLHRKHSVQYIFAQHSKTAWPDLGVHNARIGQNVRMHLGADCHRQCAPILQVRCPPFASCVAASVVASRSCKHTAGSSAAQLRTFVCARPLLERAHGSCRASAEASSICSSHVPQSHTFASSCSVEATIVLATTVPLRSERARTWHGFDIGSNAFSYIGAM